MSGIIRNMDDNVIMDTLHQATPTSAVITCDSFDGKLYQSVMLGILLGAADDTITATVTECDTADGTYSNITGAAFGLAATGSASRLYTCDVKRAKRYLKVATTDAPTDAPLGVFAVGYNPKEMPTS